MPWDQAVPSLAVSLISVDALVHPHNPSVMYKRTRDVSKMCQSGGTQLNKRETRARLKECTAVLQGGIKVAQGRKDTTKRPRRAE